MYGGLIMLPRLIHSLGAQGRPIMPPPGTRVNVPMNPPTMHMYEVTCSLARDTPRDLVRKEETTCLQQTPVMPRLGTGQNHTAEA